MKDTMTFEIVGKSKKVIELTKFRLFEYVERFKKEDTSVVTKFIEYQKKHKEGE